MYVQPQSYCVVNLILLGTETIQLLLSLTQLLHLRIGSDLSNGMSDYSDFEGLSAMTNLRFFAISIQVRQTKAMCVCESVCGANMCFHSRACVLSHKKQITT